MSRIFLSHSSANNAEAVALHAWLAGEGWDDIFLDLDPERGIEAGERWERALNEAASRCEAVLFSSRGPGSAPAGAARNSISPSNLNKRLFGILIEDIAVADLPANTDRDWQIVDLRPRARPVCCASALPRHRMRGACHLFSGRASRGCEPGLHEAGLDPRFFAWPPENDPDRPPYRGLRPLEAEDAGIFFGRDAPIVEALDQLRGLRDDSAAAASCHPWRFRRRQILVPARRAVVRGWRATTAIFCRCR